MIIFISLLSYQFSIYFNLLSPAWIESCTAGCDTPSIREFKTNIDKAGGKGTAEFVSRAIAEYVK